MEEEEEDEDEKTPFRPREAVLMAKLDTACRLSEQAMALVQDDSMVSSAKEKNEILRLLHQIKVAVRDAEQILAPSGSYSIVLGDDRVRDGSGRDK